MIFIVTGLHRTGTSMMMRALANLCPTLTVSRDLAREATIVPTATPGYNPNPNGFYTPPVVNYTTYAPAANTLVKIHLRDLSKLKPSAYQVVLMTRPTLQVEASMAKAFGVGTPTFDLANSTTSQSAVSTRVDMHITTLDYPTVVANPVTAFTTLKTAGWPITTPSAASTWVDPTLFRNH